MRRILLTLLMFSFVGLFGFIVISGFTIGGKPIGHSIQDIISTNKELDTAIAALSTTISTDFKTAQTELESSFRTLQSKKSEYKQKVTYTSIEEANKPNETKEYKLEYLWTNIGLDATKNNLILKADLSHGSSGLTDQYNISITAIGEYLSISEFAYAIEKDPNLGFRIEEFALVPYSEDKLQGTFIIKNITIDADSIKEFEASNASTTSEGGSTNTVSSN